METLPSFEDANLILRLYELRREETMRKAREWFTANFHAGSPQDMAALCPPGSQENAYFRMVTSYWNMAASFVTCGVLNQELFFQSGGELLLVWTRVRGFIEQARIANKSPNMMKNLEIVGNAFIEYWQRTSPGAFEAFLERAGPRTGTAKG